MNYSLHLLLRDYNCYSLDQMRSLVGSPYTTSLKCFNISGISGKLMLSNKADTV